MRTPRAPQDATPPANPPPEPDKALVRPEVRWRQAPPPIALPNGRSAGITASRWRASGLVAPIEVCQNAPEDAHLISFAVQPTQLDLLDDRLNLNQAMITPQTMLLSSPGAKSRRARFYQDYDILRVYISQPLLRECYASAYGGMPLSDVALYPTHISCDESLQRLMRAILNAGVTELPFDLMFLEGLGMALACQLLRAQTSNRPASSTKTSALTGWRLGRAIDYIEANLAEPIHLADLSDTVGLSRMYFAAQFRVATGLTPHAFIRQRRIARAQSLLLDASLPLSEVALMVGFSSQAHFTEAFRKAVSETPHRWRRAQLGEIEVDVR